MNIFLTFLPVISPIIFYWLNIVRSLLVYVKIVFVFLETFLRILFSRHDQLADSLVLAGESQLVPLPPGKLFTLKFSGKSLLFSFWILILTFTFTFLHWANYSHSKFPRKSIFFSSLFSSHFSSPNKSFKFKFKGKDIDFVYFDFFILCSKN